MKIEIYSDVMCPWCYIGERRFERALAAWEGGEEVQVVYRSYQLDPTAPEQPMPMEEFLRKKFGANHSAVTGQVAAVGRGEGIEFDFDSALVVNTLTAHRLLRLAEHEYGAAVQRALVSKLFEAHFERGANVADTDVLTALAAAAGLDAARVREYLASNEGLRETRAELAAAAQRGVRAVPTFVFEGQYAVEGAQPTSTFLKVLEELAASTAEATADDGGAAACADGSCAV